MCTEKTVVWRTHVATLSAMLFFLVVAALPTQSAAQGLLETPQPGSFQSGIGLVRGWVCQANRVDIEVVGRGTLPAIYGELRGDTQSACGGKANNGFSLIVNWNELGEGTQTIRALADGVEFGRAQVTVATLGQPILQGAQGEFIIEPFPQTGNQTRLRWDESRQAFTLSNGGTPAPGGSSPRADAKLEDPSPGSFQSGIGVVRGWVCNATKVEIELDGTARLPAAYGEARGDTQTACNDDGNNGFSLQVNWNEAGPGTHTVRALADGVEIGQATVTVVTLGLGSFPTGLVGDFVLANFPRLGAQTQVQWQESQQNFVITGSRFLGVDPGLCTTQSGSANDGSGGIADVDLTNPCLLSGNIAVCRVRPKNLATLLDSSVVSDERSAANGAFFLCATNLTIQQDGRTFTSSDFRLVDFTGNEVCRDVARGDTLNFFLQVNGQSDLNLNAPFTVLYNGQAVVNFPATTPPGAPKVAVSAKELTFSAVPGSALTVGSSGSTSDERSVVTEDKTFQVTNSNGGTLRGGMTLIASDSGRQAFELVSGSDINLEAGQSQTVTVRYTPISRAAVVGSIRIATNGGGKSVVLFGGDQSSAKPAIGTSTTSLSFGAIAINTVAEKFFVVTNTGGGILTGSADLTTGNPFTVIAGGTLSLAAGASQTVTIRFAPRAVGQFSDRVTLNTNAGTFVVLVGGDAIDPQPPCTNYCCMYPNLC